MRFAWLALILGGCLSEAGAEEEMANVLEGLGAAKAPLDPSQARRVAPAPRYTAPQVVEGEADDGPQLIRETVVVTGSSDPVAVSDRLDAHWSALEACHTRRDVGVPIASGRATLVIEVSDGGSVVVRLGQKAIDDPPLERCLLREAMRIASDDLPASTTVRIPLTFTR